MENIILTPNDVGGWTANDDRNSIFYNAKTPLAALTGVLVMDAVDNALPQDDSEAGEEERYATWMRITDSVIATLIPNTGGE